MGNCEHCGGCSSCGKCSGCLELSAGEIDMLWELARLAFLPIARRADEETPIYLGESGGSAEENSLILQCLEKRRLISLDYDQPLQNFPYPADLLPGSAALTQRGQQAVEAMELGGIEEA